MKLHNYYICTYLKKSDVYIRLFFANPVTYTQGNMYIYNIHINTQLLIIYNYLHLVRKVTSTMLARSLHSGDSASSRALQTSVQDGFSTVKNASHTFLFCPFYLSFYCYV